VEVLVVLVLIGITVGIVSLSVRSSGEREAEQEARRLAALVDLASEEAVLKAQEIGILFRRDGYQFYRLGADSAWQPLQDEVFRVRTLPAGFVLAAYADGLPINFDKPSETPKPHGFFLSSGERTAVEAELGPEHGVRYRVVIPILGDLQVLGPNDREPRR
jgi:general secretion pathway protein H